MPRPVFFRPANGWVGDIIPFEKDGRFFLYYLHELRETPKPGTPWNLVVTDDLVTFHDRGVALPAGSAEDADLNAYTGSVVEGPDGLVHLFYTAQNPHKLGADGLPLQLVAHATSSDGMATWEKHPRLTFGAPSGYEPADWRDPFVFWDDGKGLWRMLVAARHADGAERRRGVIAELRSTDLYTWTPTAPFWDPRRYITHECPDVFQWGDWWYLVYSEFSESFTTRYRMARTPDGPWVVPDHDSIDGRAYYAAKTAERDGRRFFFGWIATKEGDVDDGPWQWAGTMSILEATQRGDGTLGFGFPRELVDSFDEEVPLRFPEPLPVGFSTPDGYADTVSIDELPDTFYARAEIDIEPDTTETGFLLRATEDGDRSYVLRLEPRRNRVVFDRWPREQTGDAQWHISGDVPFEIELERPCTLEPGRHTVEIIADDDILVAVIDRAVSLSTRIYGHPDGRLGFFAGEGGATLQALHVYQRADTLHQ